MDLLTKLIHEGSEPDSLTGAIMPPIYMTSTFLQKSPGEPISSYEYTRAGNPNFTILERLLASIEKAEYATVFSSGLGALTALITALLKSGDSVIALEGVYGGTFRLFKKVFNKFNINFYVIKEEELEKYLEKKPQFLLFETPTNPLLKIFDIQAITNMCKKHQVLTVVDNTFATPFNQNPMEWGVDIVWHSTTKYIGGHSDVIGGVLMTNKNEIKEQLDFARMAVGVNPSPFDAWLTTRGVKTLALRMQQHERNALKIAEYLEKHPKVKKVFYPGLPSHPEHHLAKKQMKSFGGMLAAEFNLTLEETKKLISSFKLFSLAESLGGVESLVSHPATMTHASIPQEERYKMGITDGLVRFSVGIEDSDDLIKDLEDALVEKIS